MRRSLVLTLLGPDRPGLVEALAGLVARHGGNWLESRMASLAGEFAGILRVEVDAEAAPALEAALRALQTDQGLAIVVKDAGSHAARDAAGLLALELVGQDRPGIVRQVAQALAAKGVNVEELETELVSAPMTGEPLFRARALLRLPSGAPQEDLQARLESIAEDLMVDVTLAPHSSQNAASPARAASRASPRTAPAPLKS
jgi:glycine cleavage system regulatory protein